MAMLWSDYAKDCLQRAHQEISRIAVDHARPHSSHQKQLLEGRIAGLEEKISVMEGREDEQEKVRRQLLSELECWRSWYGSQGRELQSSQLLVEQLRGQLQEREESAAQLQMESHLEFDGVWQEWRQTDQQLSATQCELFMVNAKVDQLKVQRSRLGEENSQLKAQLRGEAGESQNQSVIEIDVEEHPADPDQEAATTGTVPAEVEGEEASNSPSEGGDPVTVEEGVAAPAGEEDQALPEVDVTVQPVAGSSGTGKKSGRKSRSNTSRAARQVQGGNDAHQGLHKLQLNKKTLHLSRAGDDLSPANAEQSSAGEAEETTPTSSGKRKRGRKGAGSDKRARTQQQR